jgi:hypothetical protein
VSNWPAPKASRVLAALLRIGWRIERTADQRLQRVREHLRRYRELTAQGKWSDAGKELEAIEAEVKQ